MLLSFATVGVACGSASAESSSQTRSHVKATATAFIRDLARGDGTAACRLLSPAGLKAGGYRTLKTCARDHDNLQFLGRFKVVKVTLQPRHRARVIINDAAISDSGNDSMALGRYGARWLIDND